MLELIIKISEEKYNAIKSDLYNTFPAEMRAWGLEAIKNGTPLPEHHGRLIDADAFIKIMKDASKRQKYKELLIDECLTVDDVFKAVIESLQNRGLAEGDSPTIIEADNEERSEKK